jgi:hypothetical protein
LECLQQKFVKWHYIFDCRSISYIITMHCLHSMFRKVIFGWKQMLLCKHPPSL